MALRVMPMKRSDRPGDCSPVRPGWYRPILTPLSDAKQDDVGLTMV